jgi:hypothetical protein
MATEKNRQRAERALEVIFERDDLDDLWDEPCMGYSSLNRPFKWTMNEILAGEVECVSVGRYIMSSYWGSGDYDFFTDEEEIIEFIKNRVENYPFPEPDEAYSVRIFDLDKEEYYEELKINVECIITLS